MTKSQTGPDQCSELVSFARRIADELDKQANERRERAIYAATECDEMAKDETDRWRVAFSTSYQTLRGMAAAVRAALPDED